MNAYARIRQLEYLVNLNETDDEDTEQLKSDFQNLKAENRQLKKENGELKKRLKEYGNVT
jgi:regulator of replication initiation timing